MMNPVVHFEMPYRDRDRAARFYAEADAKPGAPAGAINGGLFPFKADRPAQYPGVVIAVDDSPAAMARVSRAGGEVLGEPMVIPGIGEYVAFFDTERNRHSMLEPIPPAPARGAPPRDSWSS